MGKCEKNRDGKAEEDMNGAEDPAENHARLVSVECGPSDEVGMRVLTERAGDDSSRDGEGGGVGCMLEGVELRNVSLPWLSRHIRKDLRMLCDAFERG